MMTTTDDATVETRPASEPTVEMPPPATPARERGVLVVRPRVIEQLAEESARRNGDSSTSEATVGRLDDDGVELSMDVVLAYPREGLSGILAELRRAVATDVERMLGRPVRRLDLVVEEFASSASPKRSVG